MSSSLPLTWLHLLVMQPQALLRYHQGPVSVNGKEEMEKKKKHLTIAMRIFSIVLVILTDGLQKYD